MVFTGSSIITIVRYTVKLWTFNNAATVMVGIVCGLLMIRFGAKFTLLLLTIPQLVIFAFLQSWKNYQNSKRSIYVQVSWFFLLFGTIAEHICVSRFLTGVIGGGAQTCLTLFIAEIADDHIRGKLGTSAQLSRNMGILLAYVLGIFINYVQVSMIYIAISVLFVISFICVPPTPQYLLRIGSDEVIIL